MDPLDCILERVSAMMSTADGDQPVLPPTELYNEAWMLRLVLDRCQFEACEDVPFPFRHGARWFSEALLPSPFLARHRQDPLAESWTHADAVVGHFTIGSAGRGDLALRSDATQLTVIEAKMFSPLSAGVRNAPRYDQAARSVACIAETLRRAGRSPESLDELSFCVLAPADRIRAGLFDPQVSAESISQKVTDRVAAYEGERDAWHRDWFRPTLDRIRLSCVSWESAVDALAACSPEEEEPLRSFYERCLMYNQSGREG